MSFFSLAPKKTQNSSNINNNNNNNKEKAARQQQLEISNYDINYNSKYSVISNLLFFACYYHQ